MSRSVNRGRLFFLILVTLIVGDRLLSMALALTSTTKDVSHWRSVVLPVMEILGVISLWQGEKWLRWLIAAWSLMKGGTNLLMLGFVMYRLAAVMPPHQTSLVRNVTAILIGFPMLHAGFYIFAGLAILRSRSLRSFFDHQEESAEHPLTSLTDWILSFVKMDRASRSVRQFFHEYENRTRFPILTRDTLESLDDFDLIEAVVDYVRIKIAHDYENEFDIVSSLPRGFQAAYSTWWVRAEVGNGGFHQYFYNKGIDWAFMALEGYKLFGATELAGIMARAIDIYLREEPEQLKHRTDDPLQIIEQYVKARELSTLPELDSLFYQADNNTPAVAYIRAHIDEFVAD